MNKLVATLAIFSLLYGAGETWTHLTPSGTPPSGRWGSASVYDSEADRFIVFGGAIWGAAYNDLYALDSTATGNGVWQRLYPSGSTPPVRGFCAPVYDAPRRRMIIFGGYNMAGSCNDQLYFLDSIFAPTPRWTYPSVTGTKPVYRQSAAAAYDPIQERVIVFSGWCGYTWRNDVYVLENLGSTPNWRRLYPTGGGPGGRWGATCVYDSNHDCLYVFGGMNSSQAYSNDVWALDSLQSGDGRWRQIYPSGSAAPGRMWLASTYDAPNDRMLLFSGGYFQSSTFNDLRSIDAISSSPSWTLINASGTAPSQRYGVSYALDEPGNRFIIFGGNAGSSNYNDAYTLTWNPGVEEEKTSAIAQPTVSVKPNPFHKIATITFGNGKRTISSVAIYDAQGRHIKGYSSVQVPRSIVWNGKDDDGSEVASGVYFIVVRTKDSRILERVVKVK